MGLDGVACWEPRSLSGLELSVSIVEFSFVEFSIVAFSVVEGVS